MQTIRKKCEKYREIYDINKRSESFANWYYEKSLLGYTYGKTLQDIFTSSVRSDCIQMEEALDSLVAAQTEKKQ